MYIHVHKSSIFIAQSKSVIGIPTKESIGLFKKEALVILLILSLGWNVYLTLHSFEQDVERNKEKDDYIKYMQEAAKMQQEANIRAVEVERASRILAPAKKPCG